jgi:hypothetical protein
MVVERDGVDFPPLRLLDSLQQVRQDDLAVAIVHGGVRVSLT